MKESLTNKSLLLKVGTVRKNEVDMTDDLKKLTVKEWLENLSHNQLFCE